MAGWTIPGEQPPESTPREIDEDRPREWSDYGRIVEKGAFDLAGTYYATKKYLAGDAQPGESEIDRLSREETAAQSDSYRAASEATSRSMTPAGRRAFEASVLDKEFYDAPLASIGLKFANMVPATLAAMVPAAIVGPLLGVGAAAATGAAANSALFVGQFVKDTTDAVENADDQQLRKQWSWYNGLRAEGMSEDKAKRKAVDHLVKGDGRAILTALASAAMGAGGPAVVGARALTTGAGSLLGAAEQSALRATLHTAGEGLVGGAIGGAGAGIASQGALGEMSGKGIDWHEVLKSTVDMAALTALPGAAMTGVGRAGRAILNKFGKGVEVTEEGKLPPDQTAALAASNPPPPPATPPAAPPAGPAPAPPVAPPAAKPPPAAQARGGAGRVSKKESLRLAAEKKAQEEAAAKAAPAEHDVLLDAHEKTFAKEPVAETPAVEIPVVDNGQKVPESPEALRLQQEQALAASGRPGERVAVLYPELTPPADPVPGLQRIGIPGYGVVDFNPKVVSVDMVRSLAGKDRFNELLGLGDTSRVDAVKALEPGEKPRVVTEKQGDVPVRDALVNEATAAPVKAGMEETKLPGSDVVVRAPQDVVTGRVSAADVGFAPKRVLEDVSPEGVAARETLNKTVQERAERLAKIPEPVDETKLIEEDKSVRKTKDTKRAATQIARAADAEFVHDEKYQPKTGETATAAVARVGAALERAKELGIKFSGMRDTTKLTPAESHLVLMDRYRKSVNKMKSATEMRVLTNKFLADELGVRDPQAREAAKKANEHEAEISKKGKAAEDVAEAQPADIREVENRVVDDIDNATDRKLDEVDAADRARLEARRKESEALRAAPPALPKPAPKVVVETKRRFVTKKKMSATDGEAWEHLTKDVPPGHVETPTGMTLFSHETTVGKAMEDLAVHDGLREHGAMGALFRRKLASQAKDTPVYVVSAEHIKEIGNPDGSAAIHGLFVHDRATGRKYILISDALNGNRKQFAETLMHETGHVAVSEALERNPKLANDLQRVAEHVLEHNADAILANRDLHYAFDLDKAGKVDPHEFLSEAWSNPALQKLLRETPLPPALAHEMGLPQYRKYSMWSAILNRILEVFHLPPGAYAALEGVISVTEKLAGSQSDREHFLHNAITDTQATPQGRATPKIYAQRAPATETVSRIQDWVMRRNDYERAESTRAPWFKSISPLDHLVRTFDRFVGGADNNKLRPIQTMIEDRRGMAKKLVEEHEPVVADWYKLKKPLDAPMKERLENFLHDETFFNVRADLPLDQNTWLGKTSDAGAQSRARHADLAAEYQALSKAIPEFADLKLRTNEMTDKIQEDMYRGVVKGLFSYRPELDNALIERFIKKTLTDTDREKIGPVLMHHLENATELTKLGGAYYPMMRRGNHLVIGTYKIDPGKGKLIEPNLVEFTTQKEAHQYAGDHELAADVRKVWVNEKSGKTYHDDGNKVFKADADAVPRWRVHVEDQHLSRHDSRAEALREQAALEKEGNITGLRYEPLQWTPEGTTQTAMSKQMAAMAASIQNSKMYQDASPQVKLQVQRAMTEMSINFLGSTRVSARRLKRRRVQGADRDIANNLLDYVQSSSGYRAKVEYDPKIRDQFKAASDEVREDGSKASAAKRSVLNEVEKRLYDSGENHSQGALSENVNRVLQLSQMKHLASPASTLVNLTQTIMNAVPTLAARHGWATTLREVARAYDLIGSRKILAQGIANTGRGIAGNEHTSILERVYARIKEAPDSANLTKMLKRMEELGKIGGESGIETARLIRRPGGVGGAIDKGLDYGSQISRALPEAAEVINRATTAIPAFRMEFARTGDYEKAFRYAYDKVNQTQFDYSVENSAKILSHPLARLPLQFRKFAMGQYALLGEHVMMAAKGADWETRKEGIKALVNYTMVTTALAGALGLPTEPIKYALMALQGLGVTQSGMDDLENWVRQNSAKMLGKTGGELFTRGLTRAAGVDFSSRIGMDSMTSFGTPRTNGESDVKKWMFDTISGAPAGTIGDMVKGANALWDGDPWLAAQKFAPMKVMENGIRAYRQASEGKKSGRGKETMTPYTPYEAAVRALGFTPSREAELGSMRSDVMQATSERSRERSALVAKWVEATPAEKARAKIKIDKFNANAPANAKIAHEDLVAAAKRRVTARTKELSGITFNKRTEDLRDRANAYNTGL